MNELSTTMGNLLGLLLKARDVAHVHHWKVKSFSMHMTLGELYEELLDLTDELAEMYMGQYGTDVHISLSDPNPFSEQDPAEFVRQLNSFLETQHDVIPQVKWLVSKFEELQMLTSRSLYKLENLH